MLLGLAHGFRKFGNLKTPAVVLRLSSLGSRFGSYVYVLFGRCTHFDLTSRLLHFTTVVKKYLLANSLSGRLVNSQHR